MDIHDCEPNTGQLMRLFSSTSFLLLLFATSAFAQDSNPRVKSTIETAENGDIFLIQEVTIEAPIKTVWDAHTTSEGWRSWVAPVADVDLTIGGLIRTNYRSDGKLTDEDAIKLQIINYVPHRILTLQAELGENFPRVLKDREKQMYNVITFERIDDERTKLTSFGVGYKDSPELQEMLQFFVKANEDSYQSLLDYVEKGQAKSYQDK